MMRFDDTGNVSVAHIRAAWGRNPPRLAVHCRYDEIKGTAENLRKDRERYVSQYKAAKREFNLDAAFEIIERCVRDEIIDQIADVIIDCGQPLRIVYPHPAFDDDDSTFAQVKVGTRPVNAIPFAFAAYLGQVLGCPVDEEIVQAARVGRTKLQTWLRFLCQPSFRGTVRATHPYLLVDDVITTGGTFAALRGHIVRSGGTVPFVTALARNSVHDRPLAIGQATIDMLLSNYSTGIEVYWLEHLGHEIQCLTEAEGQFLVEWALEQQQRNGARLGEELLQRLRDRINQAAGKGG